MMLAVGVAAIVSAISSPIIGEDQPSAIARATVKPQLMLQLGHADGASAVAFSPDGKYILTGSPDHTARLWETSSGKEIRRFEGHTAEVHSVAFSPDGKLILTGSYDRTARLWDAASGAEIRQFVGHSDQVLSAAFSSDGKQVLTGSKDGTARLCDTASGNVIREFPKIPRGLASVALSPDGKGLLVGEAFGWPQLFDASSGRPVRRFFVDHAGTVGSIAFSPDGKQIVTATEAIGGGKPMVRLWDAASGKQIRSFEGHTNSVQSVGFSPDGKQILTASSDRTARLWDVASGKEIRQFGHSDVLRTAALSPDGKSVLTGGLGVWLWDTENGKEIRPFKGEFHIVASVAFSPSGKQLVTASVDGTRLWDAVSGGEIRQVDKTLGYEYAVAFSPDGNQLLTGSVGGTRLWDAASGKEIRRFEGQFGLTYAVAFSPDGKQVLAGRDDHTARLWDIGSGKEIRRFEGHTGAVNSVAFSPDGAQVLTCSGDHTARLWDAGSGKEIRRFKGYKGWASAVVFSPDGKQVLVGGLGAAGLLETASGNEIHRFDGIIGNIRSVAFSPDGKQILIIGWEGTVRLCDAVLGKEIRRLENQTAGVQSGAFSPDGRHVVMGSRDCTTRIWDVATGKQLCTLVGMPNGDWAVTDPAGRFDASNGGDVAGLHWIVGNEPVELVQLKERYYDPGLLGKKLGFNPEPLRKVEAFVDPKLYPTVSVTPPPTRQTHFNIRLTDQGGGIGRVVVKINGKELTADARGTRPDPNASALSIPVDLANDPRLKPGQKNVVEVQAFNADGYLRSRGIEIEVDDPRDAIPAETPGLWAVVVGVSRYQGGAINLRYAAKDAKDFSGALRIAGGRLFGADKVHLTLLASAEPDATPKANAPAGAPAKPDDANAPSHDNILAALNALQDPKKVKTSDVLVVYMAGHGVTRSGTDGGFYYLTCDAQSAELTDPAVRQQWAISDQELTAAIARIPALKQVMILDTCHSGKLIDDLTAKRDIPSSQKLALERMKDGTGLNILAGCASDSGSYEASRYGQGVLTYSLLLGMRGAALEEDRFVDVSTLFNFSARKVQALAKDLGGIQQPEISSPKGSSFVIGEVTADDRGLIPLQRERPLVLRSGFQEEQSFDDVLGLAKKVDEQFRGIEVRGTKEGVVFVDAREMPDSYRVAGRYSLDGEKVSVSVNLFQDKKRLRQFTVTGKATAVDDLAASIVAETEKQLNAAK